MNSTIDPSQTLDEQQAQLPIVVLASSSPRRREMLSDAGINHRVHPAGIDDGDLVAGESSNADHWVVSLAYLKATSSSRMLSSAELGLDLGIGGQVVVIGADTVCVHDGKIIGQPDDRDHAREIIKEMRDATHEVLTGVAMLDPFSDRRELFVDRSVVTVGDIDDDEIEAYLDSGLWQGKAGAYNITERLAAGWPIEFTGDETSIVGLPLARVMERLASFYLD
tara:strand:- start:81246 stop:81914 length:669 start_codon:yes stop_codon:yes gene_type:complete